MSQITCNNQLILKQIYWAVFSLTQFLIWFYCRIIQTLFNQDHLTVLENVYLHITFVCLVPEFAGHMTWPRTLSGKCHSQNLAKPFRQHLVIKAPQIFSARVSRVPRGVYSRANRLTVYFLLSKAVVCVRQLPKGLRSKCKRMTVRLSQIGRVGRVTVSATDPHIQERKLWFSSSR